MAEHGCCKPHTQGISVQPAPASQSTSAGVTVKIPMSSPTLTWVHSTWVHSCQQPGLHCRLGLTNPPDASSWLGGQKILGRIRGNFMSCSWTCRQQSLLLISLTLAMLLCLIHSAKAVTSKIFPKGCTHLTGVLLEMGNYCIHKNPSKWQV